VGSGANGGVIYVRGRISADRLGREIRPVALDGRDRLVIEKLVGAFSSYFGTAKAPILRSPFSKYVPMSHRPYGKLYAY
jgi:glutamate synthase domain-containing protein 3